MITNGGTPLTGFNTFLKMFVWHNLQFKLTIRSAPIINTVNMAENIIPYLLLFVYQEL
jgi:hypothetical protein